jgi:alanyl-tRNA synthetase
MKEELDDYEKKKDKIKEEKEDNEKKKREEEEEKKNKKERENKLKEIRPWEKKKSVFTKFKNYNKEAGYGKVNMVPHSKNNIPNNINKNQSEKIILKDKTNRYTYSGKFANYNFLQKVDRKLVDKKYKMTFAEYKKSQIKNE